MEIPVYWGGPRRGIVCPPEPGTLCDLSYYDGDPNYPRISNIRWHGNAAPACGLHELVIQQEPGVSVTIDAAHNYLTITPANWTVKIDGDATIDAGGDITAKAGGDATVQAAGTLTIRAPQINKLGNETATGHGGGTGTTTENAHRTTNGSITLNGPLTVHGDFSVSGNSSVGGNSTVAGNSAAGSRSGGPI